MEWLGLVNYALFMAIFIGIYAILALGLNVQWGFSGLFNAGVAGFLSTAGAPASFAVGPTTSPIVTGPAAEGRLGGFELPVALGWPAAMAAAGLIAWPIGRITLRFRSDYLAIATIGVAEIIRQVARSEDWLTNSAGGLTRLPRPFGDLDYTLSQLAYLGLVLACLGGAYLLVERQRRAPWGRMMRAVRDNETAAAALGKDVARRRLEAFVLGACLMGLGGALFAHFNRAITPGAIDPMIATFLIWIMLILGGSGNNRGAVLGAAVVWIIWSMSEILTDRLPTEMAIQAKYLRMFLIGLMLQLVLRFRPEGLLPEPAGDGAQKDAKRDAKENGGGGGGAPPPPAGGGKTPPPPS
ncbi:branched-chain amino acid ABC transporter permease [Pelagibius marinus]|uniref:branched-chain amino acid ABC transporter permease n=1 Tax=Pelagibius marinus TaxID=2762760 RepID=UPI00187284CA|nr:branched-chain amino acid ABC transporter permease [Pelagibius marinus]